MSFSTAEDAVDEVAAAADDVAHEFFHLLGRPHASYCGGGGDNSNSRDMTDADEMGFTQDVGLDTTLGSGLHGGPYAVSSPPGQLGSTSCPAQTRPTRRPSLTLLPGVIELDARLERRWSRGSATTPDYRSRGAARARDLRAAPVARGERVPLSGRHRID